MCSSIVWCITSHAEARCPRLHPAVIAPSQAAFAFFRVIAKLNKRTETTMTKEDDRPLPQPRGPPPGATAPPDHVNKPQVYEIFHSSKPEDRDGSLATAPAEPQDQNKRPTISDGIKSIKSEDWLKVHEIPCARHGFMAGIGSGFVVGVGRYITGG